MKFTDRELGTVLAALRMWQNSFVDERLPYLDIVTNGGTTTPLAMSDEIDALCEKLNAKEGAA